ncbi:MAG: PQQ-binding-like beta-propeller repeat protein [Deltaproteobacteria bacterium]|nr:PQQ-binding-like beta-propeller repeat protein [Deltaproteobacteria bacterium]
MASLELLSQPAPWSTKDAVANALTSNVALCAAREEVHFVLQHDSESLTAASDTVHATCLLRDLAAGAAAILEGRRSKVTMPLDSGPWELCLTYVQRSLRMSVYRTGALPQVRWLDAPLPTRALLEECQRVLSLVEVQISTAQRVELHHLVTRLAQAAIAPTPIAAHPVEAPLTWEFQTEATTDLHASFEAHVQRTNEETQSIHSDLHALLFQGQLQLFVRGHTVALPRGYLFLQLERLVALCRPLLEAFASRRAMHARTTAGDAQISLRLSADRMLTLGISQPQRPSFAAAQLDPRALARLIADAALGLVRAITLRDRAQSRNLRLRALRTDARGLRKISRELEVTQDLLNREPELYRASANTEATPEPEGPRDVPQRLRYVERWRAEIEGIDLHGVAVAGHTVIVPGTRELAALDARTGAVLWSQGIPRAATTVLPDGILRLSSRGDAELRDLADGEPLWNTKLTPRTGAAQAFAVHTAGLPRLAVIAEAERRLVALDTHTGEARWRYASRAGGNFRFRRIGRLLVLAAGDPSLTAVDLSTGAVVWRVHASAPFATTPCAHGDSVYAIAAMLGRGRAELLAIDAFSGSTRWRTDLAGSIVSTPVATANTLAVIVQTPDGTRLVLHRTTDGALVAEIPLGNTPLRGRPASLSLFGTLAIANLPSGRTCAIDLETGSLRWSKLLGTARESDLPRKLDVQLRAGALFVPQVSLHVVRPSDGAPLAELTECELVPDFLRVDEQCALYVGEESGHLRSFEPAARLSVVRN